jgi:hypothetical protein
VAYSSLTGTPSTFAPSSHASSHASGGSDAVSLAASQITSGTVATARLGSGATSTNFLRGDQTYADPVTYATTAQAQNAASTVTSNPQRVRDQLVKWKMYDWGVRQGVTASSGASGSASSGQYNENGLTLYANSSFNTANTTVLIRSWNLAHLGTYGANSDINVNTFDWTRPMAFAFRLGIGAYFGDTSTFRLQLGKRTDATSLGALANQGVGIEFRGASNATQEGRVWINAHNGTSLTQTDTGVSVSANKVNDFLLVSDGSGSVTLFINDTAYTSTGGPTTRTSSSLSVGIVAEITNGATSTNAARIWGSSAIYIGAL